MPRFRAVFFDLGYTLVDLEPFDALVSRISTEYGVVLSVDEVATLHAGIGREIDRFQAIQGTSLMIAPQEACRAFWLSLFGRILDASGRDYPQHLTQTLHERLIRGDCVRVYPDALPALTKLRAAGITTGVISDWERWGEEMVRYLGLHPLFDWLLISGALGMEKPDARLFQLALQRAGVPPEQAVHIGDDPERDCAGARAAGITAVLLDRNGRHEGAAWTRLPDLGEFAKWVLR